jgi:hypothetical protein
VFPEEHLGRSAVLRVKVFALEKVEASVREHETTIVENFPVLAVLPN